MPNGTFIFLIVVVVTWLLMMLTTFSNVLCRTEFGGVWSTIVIDDCSGSYWSPTTSLWGRDGRDWYPVTRTQSVRSKV